jgi:hypothetical protein
LYDKIDQTSSTAWIRFGPENSAPKLEINNAAGSTSSYIIKPGTNEAIGYEGCWDMKEFSTAIAPVTNDFVHLHM